MEACLWRRHKRVASVSSLLTLVALLIALTISSSGGQSVHGQAVDTDYDVDDDGLIEVSDLSQLNALRWDLDGDGTVAAGDQTDYDMAFPDAGTSMGCPSNGCTGYELAANLDFDTDGDGDIDSGDAYWNGGLGWEPIGDFDSAQRFNSILEGNGYTISNLFINRSGERYVGLIGFGGWGSTIRNVGLLNANVRGDAHLGGLAGGHFMGRISGTHVTGSVVGLDQVGGLLGANYHGSIQASHSKAAVAGDDNVGGLVGWNDNGSIEAAYAVGSVSGDEAVGGLLGYHNRGTVTASYAAGIVAGNQRVGGLVGGTNLGTVEDSYWDTERSGVSDSPWGTSKTTADLRSPIDYEGIYASWNVDLDGDGTGDDPWDFGTATQDPMLRGVQGEQRTVPDAPSVGAVDADSGQLTISWSAPAWDGGSDITAYDVQYRESGAADWTLLQGAWTSGDLTYDVTALVNDIEYEVAARAVSEFGDGPWSESASGIPRSNDPPVFTGPSAFDVAENTTAVGTLAATDPDPDDDVTGYAISGGVDTERFRIDPVSGELSFNEAPDYERPVDVGNDNEYQVEITATSGSGARERTASQTLTVVVTDVDEPPGQPEPPTVSASYARGDDTIELFWNVPYNTGPEINDYDVQYRIEGETSWTGHEFSATTTGALITGLDADTDYEVRVRASNDEGTGDWSEPAVVSTEGEDFTPAQQCKPNGDGNDLLYCVYLEEPRFGGFRVDPDNSEGILIYLVGRQSTQTVADDVLALANEYWRREFEDVRVVQGTYTIGQLKEWFDGVVAEMKSGQTPVTLTGVDLDEGTNRVTIFTDEDSDGNRESVIKFALALGIPVEALTVAEGGFLVPEPPQPAAPRAAQAKSQTVTANLRSGLDPLVGGVEIINGSAAVLCSLGFGVTLLRGRTLESGFFTAGHCGSGTYYSRGPAGKLSVGSTEWNTINQRLDAQYIPQDSGSGIRLDVGRIARTAQINRGTGVATGSQIELHRAEPYFDITSIGPPVSGETANKVGRSTGWTSGTVDATCYANSWADCNGTANYRSLGGDSGGPVFVELGGTQARLIGLHIARSVIGGDFARADIIIQEFYDQNSDASVIRATSGPCTESGVVDQTDTDLVIDCELIWSFYEGLADKRRLDDHDFDDWGFDTPLDRWYGVTVRGSPRRVTELHLGRRGIVAQIPNGFSSLTGLTSLILFDNRFSGEIPAGFGDLSDLEILSLSNNDLTGEIPPQLGELSNLLYMYLGSNGLTGGIPAEFGDLSKLEILDLSNNDLTGEVPFQLGYLSMLEVLNLDGNSLTGCVPVELQGVRGDRGGLPFCTPATAARAVVVANESRPHTTSTATLTAEVVNTTQAASSYRWQRLLSSGWRDSPSKHDETWAVTFDSPGQRTFRVIVTVEAGDELISEPITIKWVDPVTIDVSNRRPLVGEFAKLTVVMDSGLEGETYQWQLWGGGSLGWYDHTLVDYNPLYAQFETPGQFIYRVVVTTTLGAEYTSPSVTVEWVIGARIEASSYTPVGGQDVTLTAVVPGNHEGLTYQWQRSLSSGWQDRTGHGNKFGAMFYDAGVRTYRVVVTFPSGYVEESEPVSIEWSPPVTIDVDDDRPQVGESATMTADVLGSHNIDYYQWQRLHGGKTWHKSPTDHWDTWTVTFDSAGSRTFRVIAVTTSGRELVSGPITIEWVE